MTLIGQFWRMEFTEAFPVHGGLVQATAGGHWIATLTTQPSRPNLLVESPPQLQLAIHCATNGSRHRLFQVPQNNSTIRRNSPPVPSSSKFELIWSPDGCRVALVASARGKIYVFDVEAKGDGPICCISENALLGMDRILWMPDSWHLLVVLKHRVGIRIWRIDGRFAQAFLPSPKFSDKGIAFSETGQWMAILHRKDQQDFIQVYDIRQTGCLGSCLSRPPTLKITPPESSFYLDDLCFCPMSEVSSSKRPSLFAWESPAFSSRILIFAADGESCKVISNVSEESSSLQSFGFERFLWSPMGGWIAAAIQDSVSFSLWNSISLKMGAKLGIGPSFIEPDITVRDLGMGSDVVDGCRWSLRKKLARKCNPPAT